MPKTGPTANVRLITTQPVDYLTGINVFDESKCSVKSYLGWLGNDDRVDTLRVGMPYSGPPSTSSIERVVKANEPLTIGPSSIIPHFPALDITIRLNGANAFNGFTVNNRQEFLASLPGPCELPTFTPEPNANYEVVVDPAPGKCQITAYQLLIDNQGKIKRQPIAFKPSSIFVHGGEFSCNQH